MAAFRYLLYTWGGQLLDILPFQGVTSTWAVSTPGTFTGQIPISDPSLPEERVTAATWPLRTKIFMERDRSLAWAGRIVEPRTTDSSSGLVTVNAEETIGYFSDRYMPTLNLLSQDQVVIAQQILEQIQGVPAGDAGLAFNAVNGMSGVVRDGVYSKWDFTPALQALTDMTEMESGFEFASRVSWQGEGDAQVPYEEFLVAYPYLGRRKSASPLVIEVNKLTGGNCDSYSWPEGPGLVTRTWGSATTPDGVQLVASRDNTGLLDAGYPLIEAKSDFSSNKPTTQAALQAFTNRQAGWANGERIAAQFTVQPSDSFHIGMFTAGDDVRVRITDSRFPPGPGGRPGFDAYMRIGQVQCTVDQQGMEQYQVTTLNYTEPL